MKTKSCGLCYVNKNRVKDLFKVFLGICLGHMTRTNRSNSKFIHLAPFILHVCIHFLIDWSFISFCSVSTVIWKNSNFTDGPRFSSLNHRMPLVVFWLFCLLFSPRWPAIELSVILSEMPWSRSTSNHCLWSCL